MKPRKINAAAFKKQLHESVIGADSCIEVELNAETTFRMKLAIQLDEDIPEDMELMAKMEEVSESAEPTRALLRAVIEAAGEDFDHVMCVAEEAGFTAGDLMTIYQAEMAEARDRLGKFRYKASQR